MAKNISYYVDVSVKDQKSLFEFISKKAVEQKVVENENDYFVALNERESIGTTGLENHIAIPHAISDKISSQHIFVICLKKAIKYPTLDNSDVKSVICFAIPKSKQTSHVDILSKVSVMLLDKKNQTTLNSGSLDKIKKLFTDIGKEIEKNKTNINEGEINNNELEKDNDTNHEEKLSNLIVIRNDLRNQIKSNPNDTDLTLKLNQVLTEIKECKQNIKTYKKELKNKNNILKNDYQQNIKTIGESIKQTKNNTKNNLDVFNKKVKQDYIDLKAKYNNQNTDAYKEELIHYNANMYQQKAEINKEYEKLVSDKQNLTRDYKNQVKENNTNYSSLMKLNKSRIVNPKNYLYIHANKFQLFLMLFLAVVGLWAIVLGTFGTTTYGSFISTDINGLIAKLSTEQAVIQTYQTAFNSWKNLTVSTNYDLSLTTLLFGVFSILMFVPLKMFKISNVNKENIAIGVVTVAIAFFIVTLVLTVLTIGNIDSYEVAATNVTSLDDKFGSIDVLMKPLKTREDFPIGENPDDELTKIGDNQWNSYITNIKAEVAKLLPYLDPNSVDIQEYVNQGLAKAISDSDELFRQIVMGGGYLMAYKIVAISSCAAGIAHTYMAKEKLVEGAKKLGHEIKVETRGSITENVLTEEDIKNADMVIIAADVEIDKSIFVNKKIWSVDTNTAIKDPVAVINDAFAKAKIFYGKGEKVGAIRLGTEKKTKYSKYIMTAIGFMIPVTIAGGLLIAIPNALAITPGGGWEFPNSFWNSLWQFGQYGLRLMGPIMAMFLAYAIAGKSAMAAGILGGYFITDSASMSKFSPVPLPPGVSGDAANAGFLGALIVGFLAGYIVEGLKWINWPKIIRGVVGLMIIPLISSFFIYLLVVYVIGGPITWLVSQLYLGLNSLSTLQGGWGEILLGMIFSALVCVDLGGPINKTTLVVAGAIFSDTLIRNPENPNFIPNTAVQSAISIPPLAMWMATMMFPYKFTTDLKAAGSASFVMGLVGISEGALPFAFKSPLKTISSCIVGALFTGAISALGGFQFYGGLGSPLGCWIGIIGNTGPGSIYWFLTVLAGALIAATIYGLLMKADPAVLAEHKQYKINKRNEYAQLGYINNWQIFKYNSKQWGGRSWVVLKDSVHPRNWFRKPD